MHVPAWATSGRYFRLPSMTLASVILGVSTVGMRVDEFRGAGIYDVRTLALTLVRVDDPVLLVVVIVATLLVCGWAERVMGSVRMLFAFVGGGLITSVVGLLVGEVENTFLTALPLNLEPTGGASPVAALLVVATAASCFTGPLWRRRIRLLGVLLAMTLFLYSASAGDLYALVALPVGIAVGMLTGGAKTTSGVQRSSHHETRVLLAALTTVVAVGPVIATVWGSGAGCSPHTAGCRTTRSCSPTERSASRVRSRFPAQRAPRTTNCNRTRGGSPPCLSPSCSSPPGESCGDGGVPSGSPSG